MKKCKSTMNSVVKFATRLILPAIFALFMTIFLPQNSIGQNLLDKTFTVKLEKVSIKTLINEVQAQTNVKFSYSGNSINVEKIISYSATNKKVSVFLQDLQKSYNIGFKQVNNNVVLYSLANPPKAVAGSEKGETVVTENIVKGKITNDKGEPLAGVTIAEKGNQGAVVSAANGNYSIKVKSAKANLGFTSEGYESVYVNVGAGELLNVELKAVQKAMDEVVVVGYGTVKKSDLTGSVSKLKFENQDAVSSSSYEQLLQGKVAGVNITQTSGDPGSGIAFNIRGGNSLGENQPLIVIDGYPVESDNANVSSKSGSDYWTGEQKPGNALANLNPNDIESVEILKDASSTAIYGSRGANGVVMITTKRGRDGKDKITYNYRNDISKLPRKIDMLSTQEFVVYANEAAFNSGLDSVFKYASIINYKDNNWQNMIYETSRSQDHQVSLTGGDFKTKYALTANYTEVNGIVRYTNYTKEGISLNLDRQFSNRFKMGVSTKLNFSTNKAGYQATNHTYIGGSVVTGALRWSPTSTLLDNDGEIIVSTSNQSNPLITLERSKNITTNIMVLSNIYAEYTLLKNLKFRLNGGFNQNSNEYKNYWGRGTQTGDGNNGQAFQGTNSNLNYLAEYTLNYSGAIAKKHKITAVGGYTTQNWRSNSFGITVKGFPNDNLTYYSLQYGSVLSTPVSTYKMWALASYLGRLNYTFDNKYLLTFTGRADGSSRLSEGNKWSFFPSAAFGWNLHNEKFFPKRGIINQAKIKASYGISGNQNIGIGATQALFAISRAANTIGSVLTGVGLSSFDNPNLHWEKTAQYNLGLDFTFYKSKYALTIDLYKKITSDLLTNLSIPSDNGFLTYATNMGTIENKGLEIEADIKLLTKKLKWSVTGNITFNRNKVINLGQNSKIFGNNLLPTGLDQYGTVAQPGSAIGSFYGYLITGIYQNVEEIAKGPKDPVNPAPGDFKYADLNGDGKISPDDRTILGDPNPKYMLGLTNSFRYKNFDLNIFIMGKVGQSVMNLNRFYSDGLVYSASGNVRDEAFANRWTGPGTSNYYPRAKRTGSLFDKRVSNYLIEDATFFRLKNVTLSYNLSLKKKTFFNSMKVFASGTNLFIITDYKGYDPEVSSFGLNGLNQNVDFGSIPQYRTFSTGINVSF
ncbi:MAG: TonB-dependent receptor [Chitinophagaceae bacterium]|nr:TonB-dependent receptor [Chitinophagaceae bacterium]